jgi:hypothetical protein
MQPPPPPPSRPQDARLVDLIAAEVERDGGTAVVSRLISYNPAIRKLLSDRRLLPFLQSYPQTFEVLRSGGSPPSEGQDGKPASGGTDRVTMVAGWASSAPQQRPAQASGSRKRHQPQQQPDEDGAAGCSAAHTCSGCGAGFRSRTALFKHLRGQQVGSASASACSAVAATVAAEAAAAGGDSAAAAVSAVLRRTETKEANDLEQAVVFALRRRLLRMGRRDGQQGSSGSPQQVAAATPAAPTSFELSGDRRYAPLTWLASGKKAKVQRSLINYVRSLSPAAAPAVSSGALQAPGQQQQQQQQQQQEEAVAAAEAEEETGLTRTAGLELLSDAWWVEATEILRRFLQAESRKNLFEISTQEQQQQGQPGARVRVAVVRLTEPPPEPSPTAAAEAAGAAHDSDGSSGGSDPVWLRVLALLEGQRTVQGGLSAGQGDHFLGRLASDVGIQKLLAGRELVPVLRGCPQLDGPFQRNGKGWCVRLKAAGGGGGGQEEGAGGRTAQQRGSESDSEGGVGARLADGPGATADRPSPSSPTPLSSSASTLETTPSTQPPAAASSSSSAAAAAVGLVHVGVGFAVVSKPAGLSTEALVSGLTPHMLAEMKCDPSYEIQTVSRLDQPTSGAENTNVFAPL